MHHKNFENFSSLWNYCIFCPICKKDCRNVEIKFLAHPTRATNNIRTLYPSKIKNFKFTEKNTFIEIHIVEKNNFSNNRLNMHDEYLIKFDSLKNNFFITKKNEISPDKKQLSFYIYAFCDNCLSYLSSNNIKIDTKIKYSSNLYLESEAFYLTKTEDKYFIFIDYVTKKSQISKVYLDQNNNITVDNKEQEIPIFKIDLNNQSKLIQKIKTILMFI